MDGLEILVFPLGDVHGQLTPQAAKITKCDLDFKKVIVLYTLFDQVDALNFHGNLNRAVYFPMQSEQQSHHLMNQMYMHSEALGGAAGARNNLEMEFLRQYKLQQLAQAQMLMSQPYNREHSSQGKIVDALASVAGPVAPSQTAYTPQLGSTLINWAQHACSLSNTHWPSAAAKGGQQHRITSRSTEGSGAPVRAKSNNSTVAIARALGLPSDGIVPERNPQVKLRATMFDALRDNLLQERDKIMCKVTAERGMRTAVLTGASLSGGIRVKYLDANYPSSGVITQQDLAEERVQLEITQVVPIVHE